MDGLVQWLGQQLDEDERIARAVGAEQWQPRYVDSPNNQPDTATVRLSGGDDVAVMERYSYADAEHIASHDPARVLREINAKRQTLAEYGAAGDAMDRAARDNDTTAYNEARAERRVLERIIRRDAAVYTDRPGYRDDWRP